MGSAPPVALLYHAVAPVPAAAQAEERALFVDPGAFEEQMNYLAEHGFRSLRLDEYLAAINGGPVPARSVLLTFDDAYAHVEASVTPVLDRCGFTAVMFACPGHLGGVNTWDSSRPHLAGLPIATAGRLRRMSDGPWEIASHGLHHVDLRRLGARRRRSDLAIAREELSALVGRAVVDLAYPFGYNDPDVRRDAAAAGYRTGFLARATRGIGLLGIPRRSVDCGDSIAAFRLKVARWSGALYRMRDLAPPWARVTAQEVLGAGRW